MKLVIILYINKSSYIFVHNSGAFCDLENSTTCGEKCVFRLSLQSLFHQYFLSYDSICTQKTHALLDEQCPILLCDFNRS